MMNFNDTCSKVETRVWTDVISVKGGSREGVGRLTVHSRYFLLDNVVYQDPTHFSYRPNSQHQLQRQHYLVDLNTIGTVYIRNFSNLVACACVMSGLSAVATPQNSRYFPVIATLDFTLFPQLLPPAIRRLSIGPDSGRLKPD